MQKLQYPVICRDVLFRVVRGSDFSHMKMFGGKKQLSCFLMRGDLRIADQEHESNALLFNFLYYATDFILCPTSATQKVSCGSDVLALRTRSCCSEGNLCLQVL